MDNQNLSRTERREQQVEQNHHGGDGRPPKKPRRRRRIWRWLLALVLLLAVIGGVVFATVLNNVHQSINKMQRSADITKARQVSQVIKDGKPFSMLVLGTDTGALKRDRTGLRFNDAHYCQRKNKNHNNDVHST